MNSDESGGEQQSTRGRPDRGRRAFLVGAGAALTALSGCSFNAEIGGGGDRAPVPTRTAAPPPTAAAAPAPTDTPMPPETSVPTETSTPTPADTPAPTTTSTDTPRLVVLTVEPEPVLLEPIAPTPTPTPEPVRYRFERPYLYVARASDAVFDGPDTEEIYGEISVTASDGTNEVAATSGDSLLWRSDRSSAREIGDGSGQVLTDAVSPVEFVFPDAAALDRDEAYIQVTATFREADKGANDDDTFDMFRSDDRWYLNGPTVERGYSTATGESRFVVEYAGNGTLLNFSYNIVAV